ncbi:MAG: hypothetical protein CSB44_05205 [Gammaproteobacteria bacterium]|nr:MAG: hypothetical protein CSB44_05205 [Gammaproteobacteria bacterium]PIE36341.1 MAG: hypothetical protein CSA54_04735 [Gammaproteobacteria bacterium]
MCLFCVAGVLVTGAVWASGSETVGGNVVGDTAGTDAADSDAISSEARRVKAESWRYRLIDTRSGRVQLDAQVLLGDSGLLVTDMLSEGAYQYLLNAATTEAWMMDARRRWIHKVPLTLTDDTGQVSKSMDVIAAEADSDVDDRSIVFPDFPMLSPLPPERACEYLAAKVQPSVSYRGEFLDVWECRDRQNAFVRLDAYSDREQRVVISVSASGVMERWDDFDDVDVAATVFTPDDSFTDVSVEEFLSGRIRLGEYVTGQSGSSGRQETGQADVR